MSSISVKYKESQDVQACHSHEELHADADIPLSKHRKLKCKLDLDIHIDLHNDFLDYTIRIMLGNDITSSRERSTQKLY